MFKINNKEIKTTSMTSFWFLYPNGRKTSFRHLRVAFKFSYLGKTYIKCLQDNLTANNWKRAQKYLGKTSNGRLIKMSMSDVWKASFRLIFLDKHPVIYMSKFRQPMKVSRMEVFFLFSDFKYLKLSSSLKSKQASMTLTFHLLGNEKGSTKKQQKIAFRPSQKQCQIKIF